MLGVEEKLMINNKQLADIMACYKLLEECIDFEHIENREFICKNLNMVMDYQYKIPKKVHSDIWKFIEKEIKPIIFDTDYFQFLHREEYGNVDERGHIVINSEASLESIIFLMYEHSLELNRKLLNVFAKYVKV